jgi:hypothetical protein
LQPVLAHAEGSAVPLSRLAAVHEALAPIELAAGDRTRFELHVTRAAECYRTAGNPALLARLSAWVDELTRRQGMPSVPIRSPDTSSVATIEDRPEQPYARLLAIDDGAERARRALAFILEQCAAERGALCLIGPDGVRVAAELGVTAVPAALIDALPELLDLAPSHAASEREREPLTWRAADGTTQRVVPLAFLGGTQLYLVGAALLPELGRAPNPASIALIARALHQAGEPGIPHSLAALLQL